MPSQRVGIHVGSQRKFRDHFRHAGGAAGDGGRAGDRRLDHRQHQERRCSTRSIRPCWPSPARARTSATTRPNAIANTFLSGNFDPAFTKLKVVKNGTEFSVKRRDERRPRLRLAVRIPGLAGPGGGIGRHRLCLLRDRAGARHDRLDEGRQARLDEGRRARPHRHDVGAGQRRGQAEIRDGAVLGLRQCRAEIRAELRQEGQADRRHRRQLAGPPGQVRRAAVRARRRRQPLPALRQSRPDLAGLRRDALFGQQGLRRRRHAGRSRQRPKRCSFRRSASTSRTRRNSPTATSSPTPSRRTSPSSEKKKRWAKYGVDSRCAAACRCSADCSIRLSFRSAICSAHSSARRRSRSTPARPRATASPRGRAMAATCSRSPR